MGFLHIMLKNKQQEPGQIFYEVSAVLPENCFHLLGKI